MEGAGGKEVRRLRRVVYTGSHTGHDATTGWGGAIQDEWCEGSRQYLDREVEKWEV